MRNVAWRRDPRGVRLTFNDTIDEKKRERHHGRKEKNAERSWRIDGERSG